MQKKLHQITTNLVKTHFQSELLHIISGHLTEEEHEIAEKSKEFTNSDRQKKYSNRIPSSNCI